MDTLSNNMTEEEFQKQIQFAVMLSRKQESARSPECPDPSMYDCAETANRLLAEIAEGAKLAEDAKLAEGTKII